MQHLLSKVDALRSEVKLRKEAVYSQRTRETDTSTTRDDAAALRNLQTQLDDLWHGVYEGVLDARAAANQLDFLRLAYAKILNQETDV